MDWSAMTDHLPYLGIFFLSASQNRGQHSDVKMQFAVLHAWTRVKCKDSLEEVQKLAVFLYLDYCEISGNTYR